MDQATMRARVAAAAVGRLATVTTGGQPHIVPCCFALRGDVIYSAVDHKPKSTRRLQRLTNLRANPRAALLIDYYDDDWSSLWWIRVDGLVHIVDEGPRLDEAVALLVAKYEQYRQAAPIGPVIALTADAWRAWP